MAGAHRLQGGLAPLGVAVAGRGCPGEGLPHPSASPPFSSLWGHPCWTENRLGVDPRMGGR